MTKELQAKLRLEGSICHKYNEGLACTVYKELPQTSKKTMIRHLLREKVQMVDTYVKR